MPTSNQDLAALNPTRIIIADDHPLVLSALRGAMQEVWPQLDVVQCLTLKEVAAAVDLAKPDVDLILLDVRMPDSEGLQGMTKLLKRYPSTPVVAISGYAEKELVRQILACGASGFVSKNMELEEMLLVISKVLQGEVWMPEELRDELLALDEHHSDRARRVATLSLQQRRILRLIMCGKLNKEIAAELSIAEQTVKIHVSNIFRKLGVRTRTQAALVAQDLLGPDENG